MRDLCAIDTAYMHSVHNRCVCHSRTDVRAAAPDLRQWPLPKVWGQLAQRVGPAGDWNILRVVSCKHMLDN